MHVLCLVAVSAWFSGSPPASGARVIPFRTEVAPRIDPVFGDTAALRAAVDQLLALEADMKRVRDEFSMSVHATLAELGALPGAAAGGAGKSRACPGAAAARYARAWEAGARYLELGRKLDARFREIRRADDLGEGVGLTPDYRLKVRQARELYTSLLRDLREMRVAFHDQLGAELRHAGCRPGAAPGPGIRGGGLSADPADPAAWELGPRGDPVDAPPPAGGAEAAAAVRPPRASALAAADPAPAGGPAVWIEIDNTRCPQTATLTIDGAPYGEVAGGKKAQVRTRAGPRELCVLPTGDKRACGQPGTLRRAYLYEGWTLAVRCDR